MPQPCRELVAVHLYHMVDHVHRFFWTHRMVQMVKHPTETSPERRYPRRLQPTARNPSSDQWLTWTTMTAIFTFIHPTFAELSYRNTSDAFLEKFGLWKRVWCVSRITQVRLYHLTTFHHSVQYASELQHSSPLTVLCASVRRQRLAIH